MLSFRQRIDELKQEVDRRLVQFLYDRKRWISDDYNEGLHDLIADFAIRGGKRLRPILMIEAYLASGGNDEKAIIDASISMELIEDYLLIHDDIIDRDEIRRGGASLHKMAEEVMGKGRKSPSHFGVSCALLGGDMLFSLSLFPILRSGFSPQKKVKVMEEVAFACVECFKGELLDVIMEEKCFDEDDFMNMIDLKTGSYTTVLPLVLGGIFGGVKEFRGIREYGKMIGRAFQIRDDILGTFGDCKETGKPVSSDIRRGKTTLLLIYIMREGTDGEKAFLKSRMGNEVTEEDMERIREIMRKKGALDYSMKMVEHYAELAGNLLPSLPLKSRSFFFEFTDYLKSRRF